jgi:ABC-type branched-subunit amino acid transport system substrate-binding protein
MRARTQAILALAICSLAVGAARTSQDEPFFAARDRQVVFHGPGRDAPDPTGLEEIRIGYFGPADPDHPMGGDLWLAANLALDQENENGGYRGIPFRLIAGWSDSPWGTGVSRVARMVYEDRVWALIGSLDGASTHLAEQVVAKARVPLVNPVAADHTVHMANVPWMFSCLPGDDVQGAVLARAALARAAGAPFVLLSTDDHDARVLSEELTSAWARAGAAPRRQLVLRRGPEAGLRKITQQVLASSARLAMVIAGPADSARTVMALRRGGFTGAILGGPSLGRRLFLEKSGDAGEDAVFPLLYDPAPDDPFRVEFEARFGRSPDYAAAHVYDAVRLVARAIRAAGPNRARIRDALQAAAPTRGITGVIRWDSLGQNDRPVVLGTIREGRVVRFDPDGGAHKHAARH